MKDNRPVFLNLLQIRVPITAYVSFAHRVSGIVLVVFLAALMYAFQMSLESEASFNLLIETFNASWLLRIFTWLGVTALFYHTLAGVKHLIMDLGIGETLEGGKKYASGVIVLTILSSILIAIKIFG